MALNRREERLSTLHYRWWFHQRGSPISAYKFKPPAEVSPSSLCSAPHLPFLTIAFSSTQTQGQTNRGSRHHFSNLKDACPPIFASPPLSLFLSAPTFRHSQHFCP